MTPLPTPLRRASRSLLRPLRHPQVAALVSGTQTDCSLNTSSNAPAQTTSTTQACNRPNWRASSDAGIADETWWRTTRMMVRRTTRRTSSCWRSGSAAQSRSRGRGASGSTSTARPVTAAEAHGGARAGHLVVPGLSPARGGHRGHAARHGAPLRCGAVQREGEHVTVPPHNRAGHLREHLDDVTAVECHGCRDPGASNLRGAPSRMLGRPPVVRGRSR